MAVKTYYVVGGQMRRDAHWRVEWERHQKGLILEVDPVGGTVRSVLEYVSPPEALPDEGTPSMLFKSGTRDGDRLHCCTTTELLTYRLPSFELENTVSLAPFNDVHHVRPTDRGTLLVAVTGLDMVLELEPSGRVVREWDVLGGEPYARFDRETDYRKVPSTKPHHAHPNYVFEAQGEVWVTRFEQRDAVCLTQPERRIAIDVERPHDGLVVGERVIFSTVDGHLVIGDLKTDRVERVVDLNAIVGSDFSLGWCRGILAPTPATVIVGFSRLRPTRFRENVRWVRHRLGLRSTAGNLPSRIACFDIEAGELIWEVNLEEHGMSVIFSRPRRGRRGSPRWRSESVSSVAVPEERAIPSEGTRAVALARAVGEAAVAAYFVLIFTLFFTHGDLFLSRSGLLSARPLALYFVLLAPLLALVLAADARHGFRSVFGVWRANAAILVPLAGFFLVALVSAQLTGANWSGGAKYLVYPAYVLAAVMAAMLLPLLEPVRRSFRFAIRLSLLALLVTILADLVWPALFSKLPSRAAGLPSDPNAAAALTVLACALILEWSRQRWRDALLLAVVGAVLVSTFSRAGFLLYGLLIVGFVLSAVRWSERWWSHLRKALPVAVAVMAVAGGLMLARAAADEGTGMLGRHRARQRVEMFTGGKSLLADSSDRREIATHYVDLIAEAPLAGHGMGFSYAQPKGPHVRLLQEWVNGGIAGLLTFVAFFALALVTFVRRQAWTAVAMTLMLAAWSLFNHVFLEYRSVLLVLGLVATGSLPAFSELAERRRREAA